MRLIFWIDVIEKVNNIIEEAVSQVFFLSCFTNILEQIVSFKTKIFRKTRL